MLYAGFSALSIFSLKKWNSLCLPTKRFFSWPADGLEVFLLTKGISRILADTNYRNFRSNVTNYDYKRINDAITKYGTAHLGTVPKTRKNCNYVGTNTF